MDQQPFAELPFEFSALNQSGKLSPELSIDGGSLLREIRATLAMEQHQNLGRLVFCLSLIHI